MYQNIYQLKNKNREQISVKKQRTVLCKKFALLTIFSLVFQSLMFGAFLGVPNTAYANDECEVDVDVVLIMDTSGSMTDGENPSECEWQEYNPPYCESNTANNVTEQWCNAQGDIPPCQGPTYTESTESKMDSAKNSAKSFIDNLESNDQSAVVSFNDIAVLNKQLSNDHILSKSTIDSLVPIGATNIGDAINTGINELNSERVNAQATKTMILLTDGKANKPNGLGYGEDALDVAYAEQKASEAGDLSYKIFTIGLGSNSDINETMLQNIATSTGAQYYHAPNGNGLSAIYDDINWEMCQYGSISGYKYQDSDTDGNITGEDTLSGWEILLSGDSNSSQLTDENGYYVFAGLLSGNYIVTEAENLDKQPFLQTYPGGIYDITLSDSENRENIDFANADSSLCDVSEASRQCINENESEVSYEYNFAFCGENYTQTELDPNCACEQTDTPNECISDGLRQHDYTYNFEYCGQSYSDNIIDADCDCIASEISRQCTGPEQAQVEYEYNFDFCGQNYFETEQDLSCGSEYVCEEWENTQCTNNGTMEQTRICTDQYQNPIQETRQISDASCDCIETEVPGQCINETERQYTFTYNFDYCIVKDPETREDLTCDTGGGGGDAESLEPGDIIINEILQNPLIVSDSYGEWFELYNTTENTIELNGCIIRDDSGDTHAIDSSLVISSLDYAILAKNGDSNLNGGIAPDYVYSGMILSNSSDQIVLECNQIEIDRVEYDNGLTFPDLNGASMILANPALDNNIGSNWCESSSIFGAGDLGTPGSLNDSCGDVQCQATETSRQCTSNGYAIVEYSWDDPLCGSDYSEQELDASCNCIETEVTGNCISETERQYTFEYNFDYCTVKDPETREDLTCAEPTPEPEDIDNKQECIDADYYWYNESCHAQQAECDDYAAESECSNASCFWYNNICHNTEEPAQSSGGGGVIVNAILNETIIVKNITQTSATIEWMTNYFSTSRVIYSAQTEPHDFDANDNLGDLPVYGFAHTSPEYDNNPMVTYHSVTITGLTPGTVYYFHAISHASPDIISQQHTFLTSGVAGATTTEQSKQEKINDLKQQIAQLQQAILELQAKANQLALEPESQPEPETTPEPTEQTITIPWISLSAKQNPTLILISKINLFLSTKIGEALIISLILFPCLFLISRFSVILRRLIVAEESRS